MVENVALYLILTVFLVTIASTGEHSQVLSRKESQVGANLSHRHQVWEEWGEIEEEEKEEGCQ